MAPHHFYTLLSLISISTLLLVLPPLTMATFPATSRAARLYGGDILAITPNEHSPATNKKLYVKDGQFSKTASVKDGALVLTGYTDDGLAPILSVLKRRAGIDAETDTAIAHITLAIKALDDRAVRIHNYKDSADEAAIDLTEFNETVEKARAFLAGQSAKAEL